ncbi:MAG: carbohydrate-binding domain-containing protein, partial [Lachnospiraceae bacterium]|nr:carbohydrate-binding domain-containing protein [Lachnospiraceae bacterium]
IIIATFLLSGCSNSALNSEAGMEQAASAKTSNYTSIALSDNEILVDNKIISEEKTAAVYAGNDIVYYEEGKDETYGEGKKKDSHSKEEADKHTVITITSPGTYKVSGKISFGQIAVDLGKDSREDEKAVVNLILDNVEINCNVAPAIVVYNAFECGNKKEEDAKPVIDTSGAGFNLILAGDSENIINGSYVAKIYEEGTKKKDIENGKAKKKYKFDASIDSLVSFNIDSEENGRLIVNAENEGISSGLHMTVNGGEIIINAADDSINTNKDNVSVFTMNGGTVVCNSGSGKEGDGIDSNGYIVINGGFVTACANSDSMDSGIDSDKGIYINGGTVFGSGNMYDKISADSGQLFMVMEFDKKIKEDDLILITDHVDNPVTAFRAVNDYHIAVYSSQELVEGIYHIYQVSDVTGDLEENVYKTINDYNNPVLLNTYQLDGVGIYDD